MWIENDQLAEAMLFDEVKKRVELTRDTRLKSSRPATVELAKYPHLFGHIAHKKCNALIVPSATSERREYIPIGFVDDQTVISNLAHAIYDADLITFAILSSKMHMTWIKTVAGRLKSDYRYSGAICYNNFPVPSIPEGNKNDIYECAMEILAVRENYPDNTLSKLYDPDLMPLELKSAHIELDKSVEKIYQPKPFRDDRERIDVLFSLFQQMQGNGNA